MRVFLPMSSVTNRSTINSGSVVSYVDVTISALLTSSVIGADPVTRSIVQAIKGSSERHGNGSMT
jgi:hypothetical protein